MTRAEFIRQYAKRSGLSVEWAERGIFECGSRTLVALPCACGAEGCAGWAMLPSDGVLNQLQLCAPEKLREAYNEAVAASGGEH
jgi:hypothetical protein